MITIRENIFPEDVNKIKSVKGIGLKTAQRVIIDLKDKIIKGGAQSDALFPGESSKNKEEALSALVLLGFSKSAADKVISEILKEKPSTTLEELIKFSLKRL